MAKITERVIGREHPYVRESLEIKIDGYRVLPGMLVKDADPLKGWCDIYVTEPTKPGKVAPEGLPFIFVGKVTPDADRHAVVVRVYGKVEITGELREDAS